LARVRRSRGLGRTDRPQFLEALFTFAAGIDRRPLFYQCLPTGFRRCTIAGDAFFKLGEEPTCRSIGRSTGTRERRTGEILRRGERDGVNFRVMAPVR
jgi:lysylphosphatidylglycerol synthetase-like protein (DUF2156 family)